MFLSTLVLLSSLALAEDSEFAGADAPAEVADAPESKVTAEFGGSVASGNVVYYTLNGGLVASHKWQANKLSTSMGANIGRAVADIDGDGRLNGAERNGGLSENARRYFAEGRYDRYFGEKNSLYALGGLLVDPFAGYDLRSHEQLGYSRVLVDTEDTDLVAELGFDVAQENYVDGVDPGNANIFAARIMMSGTHKFNEAVAVGDTIELYENVVDFNDFRLLNSAFITSALSNTLSLKLSHTLTFDNVPVEGFQTLDQVSMVTLVATLL